MYKLGNLCFISLTVCVMSIALEQTTVRQPSIGDPLNSLDTEAEKFADVAVDKAQHEPFEDGNQKNLKYSTDGEGNDGGKGRCPSNEPLRFHSSMRGRKVELSSDYRTATRTNPREEGGFYGTVLSQRTLCDDEIFQFRIDEIIDDWNELGFGIGVIKDPRPEINTTYAILVDKGINGTWAICSWTYPNTGTSNNFKNGRVTIEDGYPMNTNRLPVGTILGVSRRKNGDLHFYFNGTDKGIAFRDIPKDVYAFVDIIDYVSKISIVE